MFFAQVWRDPGLLVGVSGGGEVRHVDSVQHSRLLMSHQGGGAPGAYAPPSSLLHLPPPHPSPALFPQLPDWAKRYPPISSPLHPPPEELLDRERAYAHDRDRHDRLMR